MVTDPDTRIARPIADLSGARQAANYVSMGTALNETPAWQRTDDRP